MCISIFCKLKHSQLEMQHYLLNIVKFGGNVWLFCAEQSNRGELGNHCSLLWMIAGSVHAEIMSTAYCLCVCVFQEAVCFHFTQHCTTGFLKKTLTQAFFFPQTQIQTVFLKRL